MFSKIKILILIFALTAASIIAQNPQRKPNLGKKYYTAEEVKSRCGVHISEEELKELEIKQEKMERVAAYRGVSYEKFSEYFLESLIRYNTTENDYLELIFLTTNYSKIA